MQYRTDSLDQLVGYYCVTVGNYLQLVFNFGNSWSNAYLASKRIGAAGHLASNATSIYFDVDADQTSCTKAMSTSST
jgi:hypothetical protein